jgi:hypothetical protein
MISASSFPSGVDGNVPTWHSRELVSVLRTWAEDALVKYARSASPLLLLSSLRVLSYQEEQGQGHWYSSVFRNSYVKAFLDSILDEKRPPGPPRRSATFTLTTAVPADSGSLHGWRILSLLEPGRWVTTPIATFLFLPEQSTHMFKFSIPNPCRLPPHPPHQIGAFIGRNGQRHRSCPNVQRRVLQL